MWDRSDIIADVDAAAAHGIQSGVAVGAVRHRGGAARRGPPSGQGTPREVFVGPARGRAVKPRLRGRHASLTPVGGEAKHILPILDFLVPNENKLCEKTTVLASANPDV